MHNNLEESSEFKYAEPLKFESCCNKEVIKATGTKQAACGFTLDNSECDKFQAETTDVIYWTNTDTSDRKRLILTETRSRYGFILQEIMEIDVSEDNISFARIHSIHGGAFESEEELNAFSSDLVKFEAEARNYESLRYVSKGGHFYKNLCAALNENAYQEESFMKKVFADA